ncbi:hypothetical protein EXS62_00950 [Candidatus Kaiserbacteria bacterium]|nr:hypothetical protein [Candidatus Kaiserbacteria bacterium]
MAGVRYPEKTKQKALELVQLGKTYAQIQTNLAIPKSTLSVWVNQLGKRPDRTRQLAHLRVARIASAAALRRSKDSRIAQATLVATQLAGVTPIDRKEVGKALLAMLYWAEGGKQDGNMKFTNTDPNLVVFFITLLRKQYAVDEKRLHVALQLHSYHRSKDELNFWSKILHIPVSQFWKIYRKPRGGRRTYRRNSHGICNLHYASSSIQRELIALGRELALKIRPENAAALN